ncbi:uncharacterized protein [Drosophila bipectinata]|uniref:uncharacterized protein n=1 Tax=Drosophila bipectinata TaxID=42026 RepID=UPI001C89C45D|nr:uncharacterized protein LOC108128610 [Drosophila bipectinata]
MFVKVKIQNENTGRGEEIVQISDSATVQDLKIKLRRIFNITTDDLEIKFQSRELRNGDVIKRNLRPLQPKEDPSHSDLAIVVTQRREFIGFLQFFAKKMARNFLSISARLVPKLNSRLDRKRLNDGAMSGVAAKLPRLSDSTESSSGRSQVAPFRNERFLRLNAGAINTARVAKSELSSAESRTTEEDNEEQEEESNARCTNIRRDCCYSRKCNQVDPRPPYAVTLPENRRYGLVITHEDPSADEVDIMAVMGHLFVLLESCAGENLIFSDCTPVATLENNLLIVCGDDDTMAWMRDAIDGVCPPHSCNPFIKFFDLVRATFVLPLVAPEKLLCEIFSQLEAQNCGLKTHKWSVVGRCSRGTTKEYVDRNVTHLADNDEILLYMDEESRDYILDHCMNLKYCFWRLYFEFDCS